MCGVKFWTFTVLIVCLERLSVHAGLTKEELTTMMEVNMPHLQECSKEHDVKIENLKDPVENPEGFSCFFACFLKKVEAFDENGMYDPKKISEHVRLFIKTEETLKTIDNVINDCSKVNDVEVSDGSEGCERAKLMFECWHEHEGELM